MDRTKRLEQIIGKYLPERYEKSKEHIREYYQTNNYQIHEELERIMHRGILRCKNGEKRVKHIVISTLYSSILTKSYELQIAFLDERIYLDEAPVDEYWAPWFIFERIEEDLQYFRKMAASDIPRIKEYEMEPIRHTYVLNHHFLVLLLLRQVIPNIVENMFSQYDVLEEDAMLSFGRYMEKGVLLYQGGEKNEVLSY